LFYANLNWSALLSQCWTTEPRASLAENSIRYWCSPEPGLRWQLRCLRQEGLKTVLIEQHHFGGTCVEKKRFACLHQNDEFGPGQCAGGAHVWRVHASDFGVFAPNARRCGSGDGALDQIVQQSKSSGVLPPGWDQV
jgi:hypothetical protein